VAHAEAPDPLLRPRLRGVSHEIAAVVFAALGALLVVEAPTARATIAAAIYAVSVVLLFASSAVYHRVRWATARARTIMRRVDHSMIFVLIAGSYTPFALLAVSEPVGTAVLVGVWTAAAAGVITKLFWIDAPRWVVAAMYLALGWVAVVGLPLLADEIGWTATLLVALGGLLYSVGAVIYARRRPDPVPRVFGYHEIFHLLVIAAAAVQFAVIAFWVLPASAA
jgi:hemolysin III